MFLIYLILISCSSLPRVLCAAFNIARNAIEEGVEANKLTQEEAKSFLENALFALKSKVRSQET